MRTRPVLALGVFGPLSLCLLQQPTFKSELRTVPIYATVRGSDGRLVTTLKQADFQIFDNGKRVETTVFDNAIQPMTAAVVLDTSGSMGDEVVRIKEAAEFFVDALLPDDRARLGTIGREIVFSPFMTGDKTVLKRIIREEVWRTDGSPVWNAISAAMTSLGPEKGRRVVLTLSDGDDTCRPQPWIVCVADDVLKKQALDGAFMIYGIDLQGAGIGRSLRHLVEDSGGGRFDLKRDVDLQRAFSEIVNELHHQYVLGFSPVALDGTTHTLDVRVPRGLHAQTRKFYVASSEIKELR